MSDASAVRERLDRLRGRMKETGVHAYFIPSSDFHSSEYTNDYFKVREYFSGFTGSAGDLLVTEREALLWTDGRYFIQAEKELSDTGIILMRSGEDGVDTLEQYIKKSFSRDDILGFDGRTVTVSRAKRLKMAVPSHKIKYKTDLSEGIFIRPAFPMSGIRVLAEDISGESSIDRIAWLRSVLKNKGCDAIFISKPEETAYLFNIRADDIRHTPVAMSYSFITLERAYIFLKNRKSETGYPAAIVKPYDELNDFLKSRRIFGKVLIDINSVDYRSYRLIKKRARTVTGTSPVVMMKAVKNKTELSHIRDIYLKDSLALTRFIRWVVTSDTEKTETSVAEKLLDFRKQIPEFNDLSFATISAYKDNAAIVHYQPSVEHDRTIENRGMLLVDSGGQYTGGTTDVTRTIVMGELTKEEREAFTMAACGMLRMRYAVFIKGTTGVNLDILAREKMWKRGIDYKHGTGHGVGYMLGVHEGPQAIRLKGTSQTAELKPGMLISDEPGIYKRDRFGVRTENILVVKEDRDTEDGTFYRFDSLTMVPIDDKGMDRSIMSSEEVEMYEEYQREVIEALASRLDKDEVEWLRDYCGM